MRKVSLAEGLVVPDRPEELVALDEALTALTQIDERRGKVVEMKFFGGLNVERSQKYGRVARYGQARLETGEGVVGTGTSENQVTPGWGSGISD